MSHKHNNKKKLAKNESSESAQNPRRSVDVSRGSRCRVSNVRVALARLHQRLQWSIDRRGQAALLDQTQMVAITQSERITVLQLKIIYIII